MMKWSEHTKDLHPFQYGCKHRPFHGGDVKQLEAQGISVQGIMAADTPAGYHYVIRTDKPVPAEIRKHFDLEVV